MREAEPNVQQIVDEYTEMWNEQDFSKIPTLVSESFIVYNSTLPEGEARGHEGLEKWMREVTSGFPDFHVEILNQLASEDTVMSEVKYRMTHEGEFNGIPPTGREVELNAMAKLRVKDDKIEEHRDYVDQQELLEQLGTTEE